MTKDKLVRFGISSKDICFLYNHDREDINQLFFDYNFSIYIWSSILSLCNRRYNGVPWNAYIMHYAHSWRKKNLKNILSKLSLRAIVYYIWKEKNSICFYSSKRSKENIISRFKNLVQKRSFQLTKVKRNRENEFFVATWGILNCIV